MWRNDVKCKYMFMFPLTNLARKGLISEQKVYLKAEKHKLITHRTAVLACKIIIYIWIRGFFKPLKHPSQHNLSNTNAYLMRFVEILIDMKTQFCVMVNVHYCCKLQLNKACTICCFQLWINILNRPWARGVHHAPPPSPTSLQSYVFMNPQSVHNKKWDVNSKNIGTHYWFTALF